MSFIKNQKGMSLVELLAVLAIIGIMSILFIPQYAKYKDSKSLGLAKTQITNDIRVVQNYTLSTNAFQGAFPQGGYGIHFDITDPNNATKYIIFADKGDIPNRTYDSSNGEKVEEVTLPGSVKITGLKVNNGSEISRNKVDFVCVPPYGIIYIDGDGSGATTELKIEYENNASGSDFVILKRSGFIN